jgi:hypothetical protein
MFGRSIKAGLASVALAVLFLSTNAGIVSAATWNSGYQFTIPWGITAASFGLSCSTWQDAYGTIHTDITVGQPFVRTFATTPSSRLKLTTQIDISTDLVNWYRFVLYSPQYANATSGASGTTNFAFPDVPQGVTLGSKFAYFRAWYKVDFVNTSNQVVAPGSWSMTPANALASDTYSMMRINIYDPFFPSARGGTCFVMDQLWK